MGSVPIKGCKRIVGSLPRYNSQHNFYECKTKCEIRYCSGFLLSIFDSFLRKKKMLVTYKHNNIYYASCRVVTLLQTLISQKDMENLYLDVEKNIN